MDICLILMLITNRLQIKVEMQTLLQNRKMQFKALNRNRYNEKIKADIQTLNSERISM